MLGAGNATCITSVILATQEAEIRKSWFKASPGKYFTRPYLQNTHGVVHVVEHLPKSEALVQTPVLPNKQINNQSNMDWKCGSTSSVPAL
jgi:hypothetical protein